MRVDMKNTRKRERTLKDMYPLDRPLKPGEYIDYRTGAGPQDKELAETFFDRPGGLLDREGLLNKPRKSSPAPK